MNRIVKNLISNVPFSFLSRIKSLAPNFFIPLDVHFKKTIKKPADLNIRREGKKIIYALTPPPRLKNVGDHAQVVGIEKWFNDFFNEYDIIEFDKNQTIKYIKDMKKIVTEGDLIFLHSGGNLSDRAMWSETARRLMIKSFPNNKIVSLPQTIFFSDTWKGRMELKKTMRIYNNHPDLAILARDEYSYKLAQNYFPNCNIFLCPDFVLYLDQCYDKSFDEKREGILLCLRNDKESILNEQDKKRIRGLLSFDINEFDTTLKKHINKNEREKILEETLQLFSKYQLVVTDRFHGVIFAVIAKTPCIALRTVDHKLGESIKWFKGLKHVEFSDNIEKIPPIISRLKRQKRYNIDWKAKYFNSLKDKLEF